MPPNQPLVSPEVYPEHLTYPAYTPCCYPVYNSGCGYGRSFVLIVVLFILLIIVGAACCW
ncbi:YjcZ family sporulation protein [Bacillus wudalianchiensis]|uniref:YjcZ family sporulation protein n=1 Tax=Pseudobacillus wudalianchiensis TaxID=1743143 RepID=UPI001146B0FA